jgi:hypothetical protein
MAGTGNPPNLFGRFMLGAAHFTNTAYRRHFYCTLPSLAYYYTRRCFGLRQIQICADFRLLGCLLALNEPETVKKGWPKSIGERSFSSVIRSPPSLFDTVSLHERKTWGKERNACRVTGDAS